MAIHARTVPGAERIIFLQIRRNQECLGDWRPHFFSNDVGEGKLLQSPALPGLEPCDLQRMRPSHENDLLGVAITAAFWSHPNKELIAALLAFVFTAVECEFELGHVSRKTGRRG